MAWCNEDWNDADGPLDPPSMVQRQGDKLVVRSIVSGDQLYELPVNDDQTLNLALGQTELTDQTRQPKQRTVADAEVPPIALKALPQCKIKRNYSCSRCTFFTQNPRHYLAHLRDEHGEKIVINKCKLCLYASRYFQKLVRHMKMVHGSTDDIRIGQRRRRRNHNKSGAHVASGQAENHTAVELQQENTDEVLEGSQGDDKQQEFPRTKPKLTNTNAVESFFEQAYSFLVHAQKKDINVTLKEIGNEQAAAVASPKPEFQVAVDALQMLSQTALETANQIKNNQAARGSNKSAPESSSIVAAPTLKDTTINAHAVPRYRPLKCSACNFAAFNKKDLMTHEGKEHSKLKFMRCEKCAYVTHIRARFCKHVKYHTMPIKKCASCDFRTPYKWNLDRHMKNHNGEGAYACSACNFHADLKQSLTIHEMNHHVPPIGTGAVRKARSHKKHSKDEP